MARKASANSESSRGFNDIIGMVLMCFAVLLLAALLSYHPRDVSANAVPPNASVAELDRAVRGVAGLLLVLLGGCGGVSLPVAVLRGGSGMFLGRVCLPAPPVGLGVGPWFCCMGLLDLYQDYFGKLHRNLNTDVGGILGRNLNQHFFGDASARRAPRSSS